MKFKTKLFIVQGTMFSILLAMLLVAYLYVTDEYHNFLRSSIQNEINQKQKIIQSNLSFAINNISTNYNLYNRIHEKAIGYYNNPKRRALSLAELKSKLQYDFPSMQVDKFDIFLINRDKVIFDGTLEKDIGFDLSGFDDTNKIIEEAFADDEIHISDMVSQDLLSAHYKAYSYAKITDDVILELSFIDDSASKVYSVVKNSIVNNDNEKDIKASIYCIYSKDNDYFYLQNDKFIKDKNKQQIYNEAAKLPYGKHKNNHIMKAFFTRKPVPFEDTDKGVYKYYDNLFTESHLESGCRGLVVEYDVSLEHRNSLLRTIRTILFIITFISLLMLLASHFFFKQQLLKPMVMIRNSIRGGTLIPIKKLNNTNDDELFEISDAYNDVYQNLHSELEKNSKLVYLDSLTQIGNRKAFDNHFESLLVAFEKSKKIFSIILIDIDNFKLINDNYGHSMGDKVLKSLSEHIHSLVHKQDESERILNDVYRIGGEEFVILLADTNLEVAIKTGNQVRSSIEEHFRDWETGVITVSAGLTQVVANDNYERLYKRVDSLLYTAKNQGKNRVCSR